ncbi:unnamed protein product [Lactuca saligna]|uniref:K+ potassium transporter integral membrane domain-containing protein n=1 Tax=Lactuca saligna TaxID=75948 RepID=A0AA35ZKP5_LACSI|nr:unnamed protein product [Lactuca saligna]
MGCRSNKWRLSSGGILSALVLVVLFLVQKFGITRVSFFFSPIMGAWTLTTPLIGIYNIIYHYPSIFKAISPHYIYQFFSRNAHEGWLLINGMVLCITGKRALKQLYRLDAGNPDSHRCLIRFFHKMASRLAPVTGGKKLISVVLEAKRPTISQLHDKSRMEANIVFLEQHKGDNSLTLPLML